MKTVDQLNVQIFADGADREGMLVMYARPYIKGFTTNPTLMRKAGITQYEIFAREMVAAIPDRPISFEVFADDFPEMERQARRIATWGKHVSVKIPITNTRRESSLPLVRTLSQDGISLNVTAMFTLDQVQGVVDAAKGGAPCYVSVFAGRIADTGVDPVAIMTESKTILKGLPHAELLWASVREVLNIFQASDCGSQIVTVPHDILGKASKMLGMSLTELSLDTVKMFAKDAADVGYKL